MLIEWLAALKDKALVKEMIKWKEDHQRISIEQYNKEIKEAETEIDRGDFYTQEEVEKMSKKW